MKRIKLLSVFFYGLILLTSIALFQSQWKRFHDLRLENVLDSGFTSWQWLSPLPQGNTLRSVKVLDSATAIAVGDYGTIIRTQNGGQTWDVKVFNMQGGKDFWSLSFPNKVVGYAVSACEFEYRNCRGRYGTKIYKTTNSGETWVEISSDFISAWFYGVTFIDEKTGLAVGWDWENESGVVYRTTDGGVNWTRTVSLYNYYLRTVAYVDSAYAMAAGDTLLLTRDGGLTWDYLNVVQVDTPFTFRDADILFSVGDHLLWSRDNGTMWFESRVGSDFAVLDSLTVLGIKNDRIIRTTDGGLTWVEDIIGRNTGLKDISIDRSGLGFAVGIAGMIVVTMDRGMSWKQVSTGTTAEILQDIDFSHSDVGVAVGRSLILHTTNGGVGWKKIEDVSDEELVRVNCVGGDTFFIVSSKGTVLKSVDRGVEWIVQANLLVDYVGDAYFLNSSIGFIASFWSDTIYSTFDGGVTWRKQATGTSGLRCIDFVDSNNGYVASIYGTVLKTTDGGGTWNILLRNENLSFWSIDFSDERNGVIGASEGRYLHTTDGGVTWNFGDNCVGGQYCGSFTTTDVVCIDSTLWLCIGSGNVFETTDAGASWRMMYTPTGNLFKLTITDSDLGKIAYAVGESGTILCAGLPPH